MAHLTGSVAASVTREQRNADGTLTVLSHTEYPADGDLPRPYAKAPTQAAPYAYYLRTVGATIPLVGEQTVYAANAAAVVATAVATGWYRRVDVAPAVPVNGYPDGLPVIRGDVAYWVAAARV